MRIRFRLFVAIGVVALLTFILMGNTASAAIADCGRVRPSWSPIEKRAWSTAICVGKPMNLSNSERRISNDFIRDLLLLEPWRSAIPIEGIQLRGAVLDKLDLQNLPIHVSLRLLDSTVNGNANFYYAKTDRLVDFTGSTFEELLNLTGIVIDSSLILKGVTAKKNIWLMNTKISQNVYLDRVVTKQIVGLQARIGGDLILIDAQVETLLFTEARIDGTVKFDHDARTPEARSKFDEINFQQSQIGGNFLVSETEVSDNMNLAGASFKRDVIIAGATLGDVYGRNISVSGDLIIRPGSQPQIAWHPNARLDLRNAELTKISLYQGSFPNSVDFNGMTYKDLRTFNLNDAREIEHDLPSAKKLLEWIRRSAPSAPWPYIRAAQFLKDIGYENEARQMSIEARDVARSATSGLEWTWESIKYYAIGYGYDLTGVWVLCVLMLLIGWAVARRSPIARRKGFGLAYSFDLLLPVVRLRDKHYREELEPRARAYFYFHRVMGYILASFLIAGLSGLTKGS